MKIDLIFTKDSYVTVLDEKMGFDCVDFHYEGEDISFDKVEHFLTFSEGKEIIKGCIGDSIYIIPSKYVTLLSSVN